MAHVRLDIEKLGERWSETLLWYARGVAELKKRPIADPTSWRYLAAIHGFDKDLWINAGYLTEDEALPSEKEQSVYWGQCQHSTWFFLPWHRGYTAAVEQILRSAIVGLGGPKEWAFPYWNYNESTQSLKVPACFSARTLPDGTPNPLFVERRFGTELNPADIALKALTDPVFEGRYDGVPPGFGGSEPKAAHDHPGAGGLEKQPHNVVHNIVGGSEGVDPKIYGLMGDSDTAALDPIFWAHRCQHRPVVGGLAQAKSRPPESGPAFLVQRSGDTRIGVYHADRGGHSLDVQGWRYGRHAGPQARLYL